MGNKCSCSYAKSQRNMFDNWKHEVSWKDKVHSICCGKHDGSNYLHFISYSTCLRHYRSVGWLKHNDSMESQQGGSMRKDRSVFTPSSM